ncbi:MAG: FliM/FliN family flagellar motor switch protein [Armatimonadota bacterium]
MLLNDDRRVEPFRPRGVHELSGAERSLLHTRLTAAIDGWPWAAELGLRLTSLAPAGGDGAPACGAVHYAAAPASPRLVLEAELAVALVCLSLGGAPPDDGEPTLSAVDLAVLDLWAHRALRAVERELDVPAYASVRRLGTDELAAPGSGASLLVGTLTWAGERPAGRLLLPAALGRRAAADGRRLGDSPDALIAAPVTLAAQIGVAPVPLAELLALQPGDVLLLGHKGAVEVTLQTGSMAVAVGRPGAHGGLMAVRVR